MELYTSRPMMVEAVQLSKKNMAEAAIWCGGREAKVHHVSDATLWYAGLVVPTIEGLAKAGEGDFIVKGPKGDFYVCSAEDFHEQFVAVD